MALWVLDPLEQPKSVVFGAVDSHLASLTRGHEFEASAELVVRTRTAYEMLHWYQNKVVVVP